MLYACEAIHAQRIILAGIREAVGQQIRGFACNALDAANGPLQWLDTATRGGIPGVSASRGVNRLAARALACDPDATGGLSGGGGAGASYPNLEDSPPGGCIGVSYDIQGFAKIFNSSGVEIRTYGYLTNRTGPLPRFNLTYNANNVLVVDDDDNILANLGTTPSGTAMVGWEDEYPEITRADGSPPESCDLPQPGNPNPEGSGDITYDGDDGNPVTEPFTIVGGPPVVSPRGDLIFPFEFCIAALCFNVNYDLGNDEILFDSGGEDGNSACCPPAADDGDSGPDSEDDPPPDDESPPIVGIIVTATQIGENVTATEYGNGNGPSLFVPRIGVARFAISVGGGRAWSIDYPIKQRKQWVPAPDGVVAYNWDVIEESGVILQVIPKFREP